MDQLTTSLLTLVCFLFPISDTSLSQTIQVKLFDCYSESHVPQTLPSPQTLKVHILQTVWMHLTLHI